MRKATLVHQAEAFLLQVLAAGYGVTEVEQAVRSALDRWRALVEDTAAAPDPRRLRFVGSHDPAVSLIASTFAEIVLGAQLDIAFAGSLGGLMALARGEADMAGCHLWDAESGLYNGPFVQRLLPGRPVALLTLAHRRLGLIVPAGNPKAVAGLSDGLSRGLRFINRQRGSGTRVWLDAQLHLLQLEPASIDGYDQEVATHGETAQAVAEGRADLGLGVETAALELGLGFVPLTTERYDFVIPAAVWNTDAIQALAGWLRREPARTAIQGLGGYDTGETGRVAWVE
jgi:putative molybdopterin biosynthesis protein